MIFLGTGIRFPIAPSLSPLARLGAPRLLIGMGLALTTGSLLVTALAALLLWAQWLADPSLSKGSGTLGAQRPAGRSTRLSSSQADQGFLTPSRGETGLPPVEGQPVVVEALSLASLALAVLAIQAIKGILPIL